MSPTDYRTTVLLVIIGIVATVPLGLSVIADSILRPGRRTLLVCAIGAVVSLVIPPGSVAALCATPWLGLAGFTLARSLVAWCRHSAGRRWTITDLLPLVALGWWTNAALWLLAHRSGIKPFGFDRVIALLTVGHFHHAGFGLTVLFAAVLRLRRRGLLRGAAVAHQMGMAAVALSIAFVDRLGVVGAALIFVAVAIWSVNALCLLRCYGEHSSTRRLLVVSALSPMLPMVLAVAWSLRPFLSHPVVSTVETMLRYHAMLNAVGLVICGLLALRIATGHGALARQESTQRAHHVVIG
ncbi:MAG: YndJ family transporter [Actinobacteria bacterium]|nr:YndJ family transporter [Actinomycetota bacterium]